MHEAAGVHVRDRRSYFGGVKFSGGHLFNGTKRQSSLLSSESLQLR